jgi:hypothetical protein
MAFVIVALFVSALSRAWVVAGIRHRSPHTSTDPETLPNIRVHAIQAAVQPYRLELALLDPQVARERWIVAAHLVDEPLCVLAPDERLDGVSEWEVGRGRRLRPA